MKAGVLRTSVVLIGVALVGVVAGSQLTQAVMVKAQAEARESSFESVQATWYLIDMLRSDLQRAGYYDAPSPMPGLSVKISHAFPLEVKVVRDVLVLQSPDGRETIVYRFVNGQLLRSTGAKPKIVLGDIEDLSFQQALDGRAINVRFTVGVAPRYQVSSSVLCFTGHFRRAQDS